MIVRPRDALPEAKPPDITRVVLPLDGSPLAERALPVATAIARHLGVPVVVLRVVDTARYLTRSPVLAAPVPSEFYETAQTALRSEAERTVAAAVDHLRGAGLVADGDVVVGHPARSIMDATTPGDIVVLTSHGRSGVRRWLLGSVAEKLIRDGSVPVVVVPANVRAEAARPADAETQAIRPAPA
jgi:nucleotide-binding universal stress UspA family protein